MTVTWPLYSCDDHLDLWALPTDLWTSRLPVGVHDQIPRVVDRDGVATWRIGETWSDPSGLSARPQGALSRAGLLDDDFRPSNPVKRLGDMDLDGLQASVIYGPTVLGMPVDDLVLKADCWRAWNDWTAEFNGFAPGRLAALPVLPVHDPGAAVAELERVAGLGHRGALVYCYEFDCGDRAWDPLWAAAQDTGLPISFHIGVGPGLIKPVLGSWQASAFGAVIAMRLAEPFAAMVFGGALERHPGCTLVLAEAGLGWIPYFVHRMDQRMGKRGPSSDWHLQEMPSDIFRRQVYVTFEEEPDGEEFIRMMGVDRFMWASDYPHGDSTFPDSAKAIEASFGELPEADQRKLTADTCQQLYRFP